MKRRKNKDSLWIWTRTDGLRQFETWLPAPIGSFSKPRRRRQRECNQTKGLMGRTITVHVRYKYLYFLCRPLQNNNVKWPSSASSKERGGRRLIFVFPFGIECCRCKFSLNTFLEPLAYGTDLSRQSRISLVNHKFISYQASCSASSSFLKLPIK